MPFSPSAVDNMWSLEDFTRRVTQHLFDPTLPPHHQDRNKRYRLGLMKIMDGLVTEDPEVIVEGMDLIAAVFPHLAIPVDPPAKAAE